MNDARLIKKYPNRRLYDTQESRYVTLADVRRLAVDRIAFRVEDTRSHEDVTDRVLLQVVLDEQQHGVQLLSREFLLHTIRSNGHIPQPAAAEGPRDRLDWLPASTRDESPSRFESDWQLHR